MRTWILLVLIVAACGGSAPRSPQGQEQAGTVIVVLDGDSLRVDFGDGPEEVRLAGINAPEAGECWADEARDGLAGLLGATVTVAGDDTDRFGRILGAVSSDGISVDVEMVRRGDAIALAGAPPAVLAAEDEAIEAARGLWSPTACGPHLGTDVVVEEVVADPPGDDAADLAGEYVVILNRGAPLDLTGWVLRDESSAHRFRFPRGFVVDRGGAVTIRTGCGGGSPADLHWCADGPVWNNGGDTALLLDPSGNVVARLRY